MTAIICTLLHDHATGPRHAVMIRARERVAGSGDDLPLPCPGRSPVTGPVPTAIVTRPDGTLQMA